MNAEAFIDTNILLYFISSSEQERDKAERAAGLLMQDGIALSTQVLAEFYVNATRKTSFRLDHHAVIAFIDTLRHIPTAVLTLEHMREAAELSHRRRLSFWDSAIIISAQSLGCSTLYTEDLQHGQRFGSLRIVNPFK